MITYLNVGDFYGDGHGRYETIIVDHNLENSNELLAAYKAGTKIVGIDLRRDVLAEYEGRMEVEQYDILSKHIDITKYATKEEYHEGPEVYLEDGPGGFAQIWMEIAQLGNPEIEFEFVKMNEMLDIGGYGLFY